MKLSELFESFEDVPEIDVRAMPPSERVRHYRYVAKVYYALMQKARDFFYAHREYQKEVPADHRLYEFSMDARKVTEALNPSQRQHFSVSVLNITNDAKRREAIRKKHSEGKGYNENVYFIPITPTNEAFRKKVQKLEAKFLTWENLAAKAKASEERNERAVRTDIAKTYGQESSRGRR